MFWYSGAINKILKMTFEYELNHFVYDCIWLNMMYIIEKWCLKWFACNVSQGNIQNTNEKCQKWHLISTFPICSKLFFIFHCIWMFPWLTLHANHFKHHFSMIYIIFNHIESYTKWFKSYSNVNLFCNFWLRQSTRTMLFH